MVTKEDIMKRFLRKLVNLNIWGGRHTELTYTFKRGENCREVIGRAG
ncbi:MAG: hypothetical protein QT01_C0005G0024 [archaeon GW2011_AR6]|nr:MAG: hypothetical protein QT01_C0005G0024 [archaeon GW2011_AR6]